MVTTAKSKQKPGEPKKKPKPQPKRISSRRGAKRNAIATRDALLTKKIRKAHMGDYVLEDVHLYRINRHTFEIYIGGDPTHLEGHSDFDYNEPGVEYKMADRFELNLRTLSSIDPNREIFIHMASCGGNFDAGMQMFAAILSCPNPVSIIAVKWARSMTSIIPLAADRFMIRPPAQYMYHFGTYSFAGICQEEATENIEMLKGRELMLRIYASRLKMRGRYSDRSEEWIKNYLNEQIKSHIDVWHTADEAVALGFADMVFDGDYGKLPVAEKNLARRKRMMEVLRRPISVEIKIS